MRYNPPPIRKKKKHHSDGLVFVSENESKYHIVKPITYGNDMKFIVAPDGIYFQSRGMKNVLLPKKSVCSYFIIPTKTISDVDAASVNGT